MRSYCLLLVFSFPLILGLGLRDSSSASFQLRVQRKISKKTAAPLDALRPAQCQDESKDLMFGEHYFPVHSKAALLGGKECLIRDYLIPKSKALGSGGYGTVKLALHTPTNQTFAIKSIIEMNPAWHKWIRAEECIQYGLDFPFITKHYCTMVDDWYAWLVLEYIQGSTLRRILQNNPSILDPRKIIAQLVLSLEYVHMNRVVIGDLTTANVMITEEGGDVKIIDFGFALRGQSSEPPSWDEGRTLPDFGTNPFSDWFALGYILFECLVALRPESPERSESSLSSYQLVYNPNNPEVFLPPPRSKQRFKNHRWMSPSKLSLDQCESLIDHQACDLISKFIGFRTADNWMQTWGMTAETHAQIRHHPWFDGFGWGDLEAAVQDKMKLLPYNA